MDEPKRPEAEDSPYLKLPWPLVAGGLAAVLLVALAAGLLANRFVRQPTVVLPPPTAVSIAAATPGTPAIAAAPTGTQPTATAGLAQPTAPNTPQVTQTLPQSTEVRATATALSVTTAIATAPTNIEPTSAPTVGPALLDEIDQAYEQYWQIRAEALLELDETRLAEVMAGEHLAAAGRLIRQLRAENRAIETDVRHSYVLVDVAADSVQIADTYVDNSVYVDPGSRVRISEPAGNTLKELYEMSRIDGKWRVISLARST